VAYSDNHVEEFRPGTDFAEMKSDFALTAISNSDGGAMPKEIAQNDHIEAQTSA
jgi:hypothetical protein